MKLGRFVGLIFFFLATASFAQTAQELTSEGQRAYLTGDMDTAKMKFQMALEMQPGNTTARNYLRMILVREAKSGAGGQFEKQVRSVKLESVKFKDATLRDALEFLKQQAAKQNAQISFVTELPPEVLTKTVTLNLSSVPLTEALRYLCEIVGARFTIEKYAVVLRPLTTVENAASPSPSPVQ